MPRFGEQWHMGRVRFGWIKGFGRLWTLGIVEEVVRRSIVLE